MGDNRKNNMKTKYEQRTPESIQEELNKYTEGGARKLAHFLQSYMANEHNNRQFIEMCEDMVKEKCKPHEITKALLAHAYDWIAFGN